MNIITIKATLVAAPEPAFVGTRIGITVTEASPTWGFYGATFAEGHTSCWIDWGDGMSELFTAPDTHPVHTYAAPGTYEVRLSDDLCSIQVSHSGEWMENYTPMVCSFVANGREMTYMPGNALRNCNQMTEMSIIGSSIVDLKLGVFTNCAALKGQIDLRGVKSIVNTSSMMLFAGATGGITEILFDSDMESVVTNTTGYKVDPTLGTGTAVCKFV